MSTPLQWEYAIIVHDGDRPQSWISYSAPHDVNDQDFPSQAFGLILGELGGKGWELVSVSDHVDHDGIRRQRHFFKRHLDSERDLLN